jgi:hypothetical protein
MRVENLTKARVWEDSCLCPETSTKKAVQKFQLCGLVSLATILSMKISLGFDLYIFQRCVFCEELDAGVFSKVQKTGLSLVTI